MSRERLGNALPETSEERHANGGADPAGGDANPGHGVDPDAEVKAFIRFCYRRRAVKWPELYDEMCAVAARGDYRDMEYEELHRLGIRFDLSALPRLAALADRVIAQERDPRPIAAVA